MKGKIFPHRYTPAQRTLHFPLKSSPRDWAAIGRALKAAPSPPSLRPAKLIGRLFLPPPAAIATKPWPCFKVYWKKACLRIIHPREQRAAPPSWARSWPETRPPRGCCWILAPDPNARDSQGAETLHELLSRPVAIADPEMDKISFLLENGDDPALADRAGREENTADG